MANLQQTGLRNTATLSQTGDNSLIQAASGTAGSFALQQGNNNKLTITQDSGASAPYVPNVADGSQIGNGNTMTVTQTGRNN